MKEDWIKFANIDNWPKKAEDHSGYKQYEYSRAEVTLDWEAYEHAAFAIHFLETLREKVIAQNNEKV